MSDNMEDQNDQEEEFEDGEESESFAELFESYQTGMSENLKVGDKIKGKIIAMDANNVRDLRRRFGDIPHLYQLLDFAENSHEQNVPDPYYEGNFEYVYNLVEDGCRGLLVTIIENEALKI